MDIYPKVCVMIQFFGLFLVGIVIACLAIFMKFLTVDGYTIEYADALQTLSPALLVATTLHSVLESAGWNCARVRRVTILLLLGVLIGAFIPTMLHPWKIHLAILTVVFLFFCVWDLFVVKGKNQLPEEQRKQLKQASFSVNVPSLVSLCAVFAYLYFFESLGLNTNPLAGCNGYEFRCANSDHIINSFVQGLAAFHMFVSSTAYILSTSNKR